LLALLGTHPILHVSRIRVNWPIFRETENFYFNPLNDELNPTCHPLALLGAHPILHVSRIRVNWPIFRETENFHFNPLNAELNPTCHLVLLGAHPTLHVSRIRVKVLLEGNELVAFLKEWAEGAHINP
jgi:hypothetical protein